MQNLSVQSFVALFTLLTLCIVLHYAIHKLTNKEKKEKAVCVANCHATLPCHTMLTLPITEIHGEVSKAITQH